MQVQVLEVKKYIVICLNCVEGSLNMVLEKIWYMCYLDL